MPTTCSGIDKVPNARETKAMFYAQFDESKRLLKLSFSRHVGEDEAKLCAEEVRVLVNGKQGPFRLLTDLTGLESMDLACLPYIDHVMELCDQHGITTVVRVIPDPQKDIGFSIMSLFHYGPRVRIITCQNQEQAMAALGK